MEARVMASRRRVSAAKLEWWEPAWSVQGVVEAAGRP